MQTARIVGKRFQKPKFLENTKKAVKSLSNKVASLEAELKETKGECPECCKQVKYWKPPFGSFAPEIWETLRDHGIDPGSGHSLNCPKRNGN